jgi:hypothetical protein
MTMPHEDFYDLGKKPSKLNDEDNPGKVRYPSIYDVNVDNFPPLKDMKLGDTGEAMIQFKIGNGGIDVHGIKWVGSADLKAEDDKDKLIKRHKKDQFKQSSTPTADADSGGGYKGGF